MAHLIIRIFSADYVCLTRWTIKAYSLGLLVICWKEKNDILFTQHFR